MTPERTLNGKAVLIGALVSFVGFLLTSIVFVFLAAWVLTLGGVARDDIQARVGHDPAFLFAYLLLGSGFTALGGLIAARIAGTRELLHAAATAVPPFLFGALYYTMGGTRHFSLGYTILMWGLTPVSAVLGGYLARRTALGVPRSN